MPRAYVFTLLGKDGKTRTATVDLIRLPVGYSQEQATSDVLAAVNRQYGPEWLDSYTVRSVD